MKISLFKTFWNAIGLAAVAYLAWTGFTTLRERSNPAPPTTVIQIGPTVIDRVRNLEDLVLVEHNLTVDITHREAPGGWFQFLGPLGISQEYIMLVRGTVEAGFDLSQLNDDSIWVSGDGQRVQITLPPPQIFEDKVRVDLQNSRILSQSDRCPSFLCASDLEAYRRDIEPPSKVRMITVAREEGILKQAAANGQHYFEELLTSLGFDTENIRVVVTGYDQQTLTR